MEVYDGEGNLIYTNLLDVDAEIRTKAVAQTEDIYVYIEEIEGKQILFASLKGREHRVITAEDISEIFEVREEQISFFTRVSMASSLIIALILYVFCHILTRRIHELNKAVLQISKGNYQTRVPKMGSDEIGTLGTVFNQMAGSVNKNIEEINKVSEARQSFVNNITHEISTPLTSIIGFSSLIKNGKITDRETITEYADKIYNEGMYINKISDKLMNIIMLGNSEHEFEKVNLSEVIEEIALNAKDIFNGIQIETNIYENVYVKADKELIRSLMMNLIKNSSESYENGYGIVVIELSKDKVIRVGDYGKGMTEEDIDKVKAPFYTLSKSRTRGKTGMGLRNTTVYEDSRSS
ncbi:MAG: HAMP domain-containing histidine kinase [Oscillospiraceae bacterium]|nr:HAMP domain-containing histidine kinase [Oscillospiraceae bacterium]